MALEVRIPKEITEYKEKIIFGLSIRQLICFSSAMVLCGATYCVLINILHINKDIVGYIIPLEAVPLLALGFFRKNGFTFEKYFRLILRHQLGILKRRYKMDLRTDSLNNAKNNKHSWIFENNSASAISKTKEKECERFTANKKNKSHKLKITKQKIKIAAKYQH